MGKYNPGDLVAVKIASGLDEEGYCRVISGAGYWGIHEEAFHPLPPTASPEMLAIVDAAIRRHLDRPVMDELDKTVVAYLASITPPDPVDELLAAAEHSLDNSLSKAHERTRLSRAIAAVRASRAKSGSRS